MSDAGLEEERDFLLRSLDDLEAEHAAGDLSDADYRALKADYTTRAAAVIRRLEPDHATDEVVTATVVRDGTLLRRGMWTVGIIVVAALAGVLLARFSGSRTAGDTITGDIRTTSRELLVDAQNAFGSGDYAGAIEIYDDVLEMSPANVEALAYKAWVMRLSGDVESALPIIEDAVAIDPEYVDARVFATAIALDNGDIDAARGHLAAFDQLDAPPFMNQLVTGQGLRTRLAQADVLARVEPVALVDDPVPFSESGLSLDDVLLAADALAIDGDLLRSVELLEWVLVSTPDDPDALAGQGWLLARAATPEDTQLADVGLSYLDRALVIDPAHPEALVYRSFVHSFLGDTAAAAADLAAYDALPERPAELDDLINAYGLRQQIAAG